MMSCDETPSAEQASNNNLILAQGISFHSLCERHLLPFHGQAHIAYLPAGRVIDSSRLLRLLDVLARRLQMTQRLTDQVARAVQDAIQPRGVAVRLEAAHSCKMVRGIERRESLTLTSTFLGAFDRDMALRQQFFWALQTTQTPPRLGEGEPVPVAALDSTSAAGEMTRRGRYFPHLAPPPELRGR
jgi:GTP cyclohydrolase I